MKTIDTHKVESHQPYFFEEETVSLSDLAITLARNIKLIIIIPVIMCTLMIVYVLAFTSPVYTS
ncbi:MAG: Wzz/FepE/Etk N-terminal domain-containing protein, partial [Gammaproteobacteria bacterium]